MMGAAASGTIFVPINPALRPTQVAHIVADCGIKILVTSRLRVAEFGDALAACPSLERIIFVEDEEAPLKLGAIPCQSMRHFIETGADDILMGPRRRYGRGRHPIYIRLDR